MNKTCPWCGEKYDTNKGSSMFCESNPNYVKNKKYRNMKPNIVKIVVYIMPNRKFPKTA